MSFTIIVILSFVDTALIFFETKILCHDPLNIRGRTSGYKYIKTKFNEIAKFTPIWTVDENKIDCTPFMSSHTVRLP